MAGSLPRAERPVAMGTGAKVECVRARSGDGRRGGDRARSLPPRSVRTSARRRVLGRARASPSAAGCWTRPERGGWEVCSWPRPGLRGRARGPCVRGCGDVAAPPEAILGRADAAQWGEWRLPAGGPSCSTRSPFLLRQVFRVRGECSRRRPRTGVLRGVTGRRREASSAGIPLSVGVVRSSFSCRAVAQPLVPVLGTHSIQARSLQPQWRKFFHVRDRELLQSFMSSLLLQTEDTKKLQSKISSSY